MNLMQKSQEYSSFMAMRFQKYAELLHFTVSNGIQKCN